MKKRLAEKFRKSFFLKNHDELLTICKQKKKYGGLMGAYLSI